MGSVFDVGAYLDTLGPMSVDQRLLVDETMARAAALDGGTDPEFLQQAGLYVATLVLVGNVSQVDDEAWRTLELLHARHTATRAADPRSRENGPV